MTTSNNVSLLSSLGAGNASIMKNRLINGAMVIDQRNAGASISQTSANTNIYTLDRWKFYGNTGTNKFTVQQNAGSVTPPVGFSNYLGITSSSANTPAATDEYFISQAIEGYNIADLNWGTANAKTCTLSFWVYSSLTGSNFGGVIKSANSGYTFPFSFSISSPNTWTQISVVISGPTTGTFGSTNGIGFTVLFNLGTGATYLAGTSGTWTTTFSNGPTGSLNILGTNGATFYITGVQLEVGSSATGFEYRQYQQELALCQRYYQVEAGSYGYAQVGTTAWVRSTSTFVANQKHTVPMRASPTGTSLGVWYAGDSVATNYQIGTSSVTVGGNSIYSSTINWTGISGGTFNSGGACSPNSGPSNTGGYTLSAEL